MLEQLEDVQYSDIVSYIKLMCSKKEMAEKRRTMLDDQALPMSCQRVMDGAIQKAARVQSQLWDALSKPPIQS
jgi:hypothetical protein